MAVRFRYLIGGYDAESDIGMLCILGFEVEETNGWRQQPEVTIVTCCMRTGGLRPEREMRPIKPRRVYDE